MAKGFLDGVGCVDCFVEVVGETCRGLKRYFEIDYRFTCFEVDVRRLSEVDILVHWLEGRFDEGVEAQGWMEDGHQEEWQEP